MHGLNLTEVAFMGSRHTELKLKICYRTGKKNALPYCLTFFFFSNKKLDLNLNLTEAHSSRKSKILE